MSPLDVAQILLFYCVVCCLYLFSVCTPSILNEDECATQCRDCIQFNFRYFSLFSVLFQIIQNNSNCFDFIAFLFSLLLVVASVQTIGLNLEYYDVTEFISNEVFYLNTNTPRFKRN